MAKQILEINMSVRIQYIAKYYNEDLEVLNSFVIAEAIYWKLKQSGKPFHIFTNGFTDYIDNDWKIF